MEKLKDRLDDMEPDAMPDYEFAKVLIHMLPLDATWRNFSSSLRRQLDENPKAISSMRVVTEIANEWWAQNEENPETMAKVFGARSSAEKRKRAESQRSYTNKRPRPVINKAAERCTNQHCKRTGHSYDECVAYGGGSQGKYLWWWKGPKNLHLKPGTPGAPRFPISENTDSRPRVQEASSVDSSRRSQVQMSIEEEEVGEVNKMIGNHLVLQTSGIAPEEEIKIGIPIINLSANKSNRIYHDSGANRHVFWDRHVFIKYQDISPIKICGFGEELSTSAIGKGVVRLCGNINGERYSFDLQNILHVPAARSNLISQAQLDRRGVTASFIGDGKLVLTLLGKEIMNGKLENDLYRLNLEPVKSNSLEAEEEATNVLATTDVDFYIA
jgi:hypothetical protein